MPAAIVARELGIRLIETVCIASYHDYKNQGELEVLKDVAPADQGDRRRQGQRRPRRRRPRRHRQDRKIVRDMLPNAHFATVYAKPPGRPLVDTFVTEVSQDTWIYFPWDMGLAFQPPIGEGTAG